MKNIFYIALFCLIAVGCEEQLQPTFSTQNVAFDGTQTNFGFTILGDNQPVPSGIPVYLMGNPVGSATNYSFEIDASSTAIEGIHYSTSGNSGSIPANASFGDLPIMVLPDNFSGGESVTLQVKLTGSNVLAGLDEATFTLVAQCPSEIVATSASYTGVTIQGAFGATSINTDVTITRTGENTYIISDVHALFLTLFGCCGSCNMEAVEVTDICDEVTVKNTQSSACSGWSTNAAEGFGPGTYNSANGVITLPIWSTTYGFGLIVEFTPN